MNITASQKNGSLLLRPGFLYSSGVRVCRSQIYRAVQRAVSSFIPAWRFALDPVAFGSVMLGLFGVTIGALYQRRAQGDGHIFANTFLQYVTLTISMGAISLMFESAPTQWSLSFALGLGWLVIGVSVLAIMLLIFMIRSGEATKVATYFYLVPILTAAEAWLLFGEAITLPMLVGMAITIIGLIFVIRE